MWGGEGEKAANANDVVLLLVQHGCPQGGVLSPILVMVIVDKMRCEEVNCSVKATEN